MSEVSELPVNQKEYLKKYLAIGKAPGEKKKKKKKKLNAGRVQIIDDDAEANCPTITIEEDLVNEDAPQIVAIIDERPPSMRVDEKTNNPLWQPIGTVEGAGQNEQKQLIKGFKIGPKPVDKPLFADRSPPRRKKRTEDGPPPVQDQEPKETFAVPDKSPPRRKKRDDSPRRKNDSPKSSKDDDFSPPRRNREDMSPPRRRNDDSSPPRKRKLDSSPPRRSKNDFSPSRRKKDSSPPRRSSKSDIVIKEERRSMSRSSRWEDNSPPRRSRDASKAKKTPRTHSPPEIVIKQERRSVSRSSRWGDASPPRRETDKTKTREKKMEKTLDGKAAGLQNARELMEETKNFKSREDNLFQSLAKDVSGESAQTVHRDRKTGRIRDPEEEKERQRKKQEEEEKNKAKYEKWGRGLAQVESRDQQIKEEIHEMSKPLARYADDEDLEKFLKEREREGDPMLQYLRKKKRKKAADKGEVEKPRFEGEFMPNRYGIRPGHRWDGVDRSNGYEKKWFEVQNEKKAIMEDSYKWSTEDM